MAEVPITHPGTFADAAVSDRDAPELDDTVASDRDAPALEDTDAIMTSDRESPRSAIVVAGALELQPANCLENVLSDCEVQEASVIVDIVLPDRELPEQEAGSLTLSLNVPSIGTH